MSTATAASWPTKSVSCSFSETSVGPSTMETASKSSIERMSTRHVPGTRNCSWTMNIMRAPAS